MLFYAMCGALLVVLLVLGVAWGILAATTRQPGTRERSR